MRLRYSLEPGQVGSDGEMKDDTDIKHHIYTQGAMYMYRYQSSLLDIPPHLTLTKTKKGWDSYVYFLRDEEIVRCGLGFQPISIYHQSPCFFCCHHLINYNP